MQPETILAFDTSAAHCAAALLLPDGRLIQRHEDMAKGQGERLIPLLEEILAEGEIPWAALTALAVGTGPGNFTGVRIAVAAARGLALGLKIPAVGVTRFEALAFNLPRPLRVMEDARRGMLYRQDFLADGRVGAAELVEIGTGSDDWRHSVTGSGAALAGLVALPPVVSLAEAVARIGRERARSPAPRPAPFYLRGADAAPPSDPPPVILDA